jgi:hypothetical protein
MLHDHNKATWNYGEIKTSNSHWKGCNDLLEMVPPPQVKSFVINPSCNNEALVLAK